MRIEHVDATNSEETTIVIEGFERATTLLHVTDSHMTEVDERDPEAMPAGKELGARFRTRSPEGLLPHAQFRSVLARARQSNAEYVVLTGDIMHFPSSANIETLSDELNALDLPFLYTLGNHDWHFPHLAWSDETRASYYPRFESLTQGNPAYQARELAGIRLVAIDNSNYQVSPAQLAFLQEQLASELPCLLLLHIPIALPSLTPDVLAEWGAPIMMAATGWTAESQAEWKVRDNDPSTLLCHRLLTEDTPSNLVSIFCGHIHFAHADVFGDNRFQYVTGPGFAGASRVIRLLPG